MSDPVPAAPIPAATVVVMRDRAAAPPLLLMVERARAMAFAPGALVFPGGRIDPGDRAFALASGGEPEDAAAVAAIRETIEEAGLPLALTPPPDAATLALLRAALHAGEPIAQALAAAGLTLDPTALVPFARWLPDHAPARIFDTRFFLARARDDAEASVDRTENVRLLWSTAAEVLAEADAGRATIIFPTRRNLERFARFASFDEAAADARARPIRTVTPWLEERGGVAHLCIPDDLGYPVTAEPLTRALRG